MNVEHIPAEDVDVLPCGADWQSRHLESERRKAEIRDRIHVSKFYHGDYYLEEELKTTRGKGFRSRKKLSI